MSGPSKCRQPKWQGTEVVLGTAVRIRGHGHVKTKVATGSVGESAKEL